METVTNNQSGVEIQLSLFEAIKDLLLINPIFLLGIILIGIFLVVIFKKNSDILKVKTSILSLAMYYYLCLTLSHIVGIPTFSEYIRLSQLGETFFNPNINLIPFSDGFSLSFILNILLFVPLGFLCPLISKTFERLRNTFLIGFGLSLFIETIQLFTLHRATDIDDLLTNVIGTIIGYFCFKLIAKLRIVKLHSDDDSMEQDYTVCIPIAIIIVALILGFFS